MHLGGGVKSSNFMEEKNNNTSPIQSISRDYFDYLGTGKKIELITGALLGKVPPEIGKIILGYCM